MYLKSLEIQGFKSFPDKTLIRFDSDITAIVGPNGSGKSNISDALLWVMGEQSTKTLRGAKMEDVIFGGTQKRSAVGFAEATLTLDNSDRGLPYEADEVMITRRYYRSGDSEYYINRQSARLRDIHELFMDTGLGREGYSNIGQGRIDEILSLKSADRREIFEEAAGISKYRHRKEETERKLSHTEDNLMRIGDKVSELELQLEPLRQQSEKAIKYLALRDELQGVEVAVWMDKLEKLSADAKKAEEDFASASFVLQQAHEDLENLYASTEAMGAQLRQKNEEVDNLRVKVSMLEGAHQQIDGQIAVLRGAVANNEENLRRSQADIRGQEDRSSGIAAQMAQIEERIGQIDVLLAAKEIELNGLQQVLTSMTANAQGITRQFMELRTREVKLTADLAVREADLRGMESRQWESGQREKQLLEEIASGEEKEKEAQANLDTCRKELRKAREEVTANQNTIAGYALRQTTRKQRAEDLAQEVQKLQTTLNGIQAKARVFRAMEQDLEGYNKSVRQVMQEAKRGSLRNVHGPVSKLIRTEDDYTVAIEIALGAAMQQIVVENEADGKAAISYLKRTNGGRATFLPISALRPKTLQENGLQTCAGFVGIASDLITADPKYRGVVENLLGRTVIVENIDNAISMAKRYANRFKIVTLDGQVMNPGGSMTGGSVSREAGILSRANELEKLTANEKKLSEKLHGLESQYQEARRVADQVEFQLNTAREQLAEAEKQVLTLEGQEKQHEIWVQAILDAVAAARREQDALKERTRQDKEQRAAIQAEVRVYRTQLEETRQSLKTLEGSQTDAEKTVAAITDEMNDIRSDKAALDAERTTAQSHITDLKILQAAAEGDREKKLADMDDIRLEIESLNRQIAQQLERQRENDADTARARSNMESALSNYAALEARKSKNESEIQEKNKSLMNMQRACTLLETKKETTAIWPDSRHCRRQAWPYRVCYLRYAPDRRTEAQDYQPGYS